ncbi:MAG: Lipolytic enzyme, G-D-S-L [uncultured bacterium]|nr:MAG: Lipolytic enzyme, G-D-S-L [uncultured bacterium]
MKNILCFGDSNTWGSIAGSTNLEFMLAKRFDYGVRWTGVLQNLFGADYHVIEAGLNGRNTSFDETWIVRPSRNGLATLPGILEMHYPLDLVVLMLGTNDLRIQFNTNIARVTEGMKNLIQTIKKSHFGINFSAPKIMIIAPAPIFKVDLPVFNTFFDEQSVVKSHELVKSYKALAKEELCHFIDAGKFVKVSTDDGIHIETESHRHLAEAIMQKIKYLKL